MKVVLFVLMIVLSIAPARAAVQDKYNVTPEEHAVCDQDAIALCSDTYPDQDQLLVCMKAKRAQLTQACREMFESGMRRRGLRL